MKVLDIQYQNKLKRLHGMEDVINMELKYQKNIDCIVKRFLYQKNMNDLSQDIQDFYLTEEEMTILDIFYCQWEEESMEKKSLFGLGQSNVNYAKYFIGESFLNPLANNQGVGVANVTFEPGCRNNWHIHHKGAQILLVTDGRGYYQEWGKEAIELHPGDVVNIPTEVKHWHGAAKDSWFAHIAIEVPAEGASNEWCEPVSDEEYNKLK